QLFPAFAGAFPFLAAVDPNHAEVLYLRLASAFGQDALAISTDQGQSLSTALQLTEQMTAFVLGSDGTLHVGTGTRALCAQPPDPGACREREGPQFPSRGDRGGVLYACGDSQVDGYALATSTDQGQHFEPKLLSNDLSGPASCGGVGPACAFAFEQLQNVFPP